MNSDALRKLCLAGSGLSAPSIWRTKKIRICFLLLFALSCVFSSGGASTNQVRIGILPFANLSGKQNLNVWRKEFPNLLGAELQDAVPPRLHVYVNAVLRQLTNNTWDGQQTISSELSAKVARDLRLEKMISGNFNQTEKGWEVEVRIFGPGFDARPLALLLKDVSIHALLLQMAEKISAALDVTPEPSFSKVWRKHPISNDAIQKVAELH